MNEKNLKDVKTLIKMFNDFNLSEMEITEGDFKLRLTKFSGAAIIPQPPINPLLSKNEENTNVNNGGFMELKTQINGDAVDFNRIKEIKSPMIGVFYTAPAEGAEPFVRVGSRVKKGDTLCIIEAMKMMNEITAETDGEIVDIVGKNGEVIEFGQVIFKIF